VKIQEMLLVAGSAGPSRKKSTAMSRYTCLAVLLPVALLLLSQVGLGSSSSVLSLHRMAKAEWAGGLIANHD